MVKVFEKVDGLLIEVDPAKADEARKGRRWARMVVCEMDVLFTAEEEAERDAMEAAAAADNEAAEAREANRAEVFSQLAKLGIDPEKLRSALR